MDDCTRFRNERRERWVGILTLRFRESMLTIGCGTVYITGRRKDVLDKAISTFEKQHGFGEIIS